MRDVDKSLLLVSRLQSILLSHEVKSVLIGGFALPYNNVSRATEDIDIGVFNADFYMRVVVNLRFSEQEGYRIDYSPADSEDVLER